MVLHRILGIATELARNTHPTEGGQGDWVHITLIALPLVPDIITKQIASKVYTITNCYYYSNTLMGYSILRCEFSHRISSADL